MEATRLTEQDRLVIWTVVLRAADRLGGHAYLFARPLEFDYDEGRVRFHWPEWMQEIREYIVAHHGERRAQELLFEVFNEVMSRERYEAQHARHHLASEDETPKSVWR